MQNDLVKIEPMLSFSISALTFAALYEELEAKREVSFLSTVGDEKVKVTMEIIDD